METNAIVSVNRQLTPQIWQMIMSMAPVLHTSRLFGVASPEQAAAIMLKGYELGLSVTASFEFISVIQGKPGLNPRGALALLHSHPDIEQIEIRRLVENAQYIGHECYMRRRGGFEHTSKFTLEDAKRAGLIKPGSGWVSYPENMCMWRAIGFVADVVAPDLTAGMTTFMKAPEEYIEAQFAEVSAAPVETTPAVTLQDLINEFGPEAVMLALPGGVVPGTDAELNTLALSLREAKLTTELGYA